jgi:acyl transferase domain-containing protein/3-hydroxymyristoyl/3-hydroxydecanoyl-(acyl carrier protein) dehydratase
MGPFAPIAIVGHGCVVPGAASPKELWRLVLEGGAAYGPLPAHRWRANRARLLLREGDWRPGVEGMVTDHAGFVVEQENADASGQDETALAGLEAMHGWLLRCGQAALRQARIDHSSAALERTGAIVGNLCYPTTGLAEFAEAVWTGRAREDLPNPRNRFASGYPAHLLCRRLKLGVGGYALDAACASSLYAIKLAADWLNEGRADAMLAGGVNGADFLGLNLGFTALNALSASGRSRPFHAEADGLIPAEGAALLVLKRLNDAWRDENDILGVIRGVGLGNDGSSGGFLAPSQEAQRRAIEAAYAACDVDPADVSYLECHATGTLRGDAVEIRAAAQVFCEKNELAIGSLKANIGHLTTAAGAAGLIKVLMSMRAGTLPATPNAFPLNPALSGTRLRVLARPAEWASKGPRRAAISAFGFGGNNAHLIVEEAGGARASSSPAMRPPRGAIAVVGLGAHAGAHETAEAVRRQFFLGGSRDAAAARSIELPLGRLRFPPNDLGRALPQQLLMTRVALAAIGGGGTLPRRTAVLIGMGCDPSAARTNFRARTPDLTPGAEIDSLDVAPMDAATVVGAMANVLANRLNANFDLHGPSFAVAAEEASGLRALEIALGALRRGEVDTAIVGAVDLSVDPVHEAATAFLGEEVDDPADAACALLLKRREDAERDGDPILACFDDDADAAHRDWRPYQSRHRDIFGRAHAADGLFALCGAILSIRDGILPPQDGRPAAPWLQPPERRRARLHLSALAADPLSVALRGGDAAPSPWPGLVPPLVLAYGGNDASELAGAIAADRPKEIADLPLGPRFVAVATIDRAAARASMHAFIAAKINGDQTPPLPPGIAFSPGPVGGEIAFVFTGAAAGYPGMGRELLLAYKSILAEPLADAGGALDWSDWMFHGDDQRPPDDFSQLVGTTILCQAHAAFAHLIGLTPDAALGLSSGETNALFALGAWRGQEELFDDIRRSGLYANRLGGAYDDVKRHWRERGVPGERWANYTARATKAELEDVLSGETAVHLLIVYSPLEVLIGGEEEACARVVKRLGAGRAARLNLQLAVHCPEVEACAGLWRRLHHRPTKAPPKTRFYFNAVGRACALTDDAVAELLLSQALSTIDFPRTVRQAWDDGVRIFVEMGPRGQCCRWIGETLGAREHVAVPFDDPGRTSLAQAWQVAATLLAAGVVLDLGRLAPADDAVAEGEPTRAFPAHFPPIRIPRTEPRQRSEPPQIMLPPGAPPLFVAGCDRSLPVAIRAAASDDSAILGARLHDDLTASHLAYLEHAANAEAQFQTLVRSSVEYWGRIGGSTADQPQQNAKYAAPATAEGKADERPGPRLDRRQLEFLAEGKISQIFGPLFEQQDDYLRQVRMPKPPLLLVDRVMGIAGQAGSMGLGAIWTETDVAADAWYLHDGRVPPGIVIEAGQADLLLISWLGADFHNRGERVYRLLGCEMTIYGGLPKAGDTLRYDIHVDGHARTGATALFFFHYDLYVGDALRMRVRNGQAGFFTDAELTAAQGVLWSPDSGEHKPAAEARVDPPQILCRKNQFTVEDMRACSEGRISAALGPGFELTDCHTRTPRLPSGRMLLLQTAPVYDPQGGPWGRGYLRAEWSVRPDDWFFEGHFKNDPCMPGTLMLEACVQAMSFFMISLGMTVARDGWRFEPAPERAYRLRCRSQVTPTSQNIAYEVFVEEVINGPVPTLIADVLGSVDGIGAVHCHGFELRLVPDWPLDDRSLKELAGVEMKPVAARGGHAFDHASMLACALGRPSRAFGPFYGKLDGPQRVPRLPGPPFLCMSRVLEVVGEIETPQRGAIVKAEYDIPADAWYFTANAAPVMPFSILLEAALQPCGWLASYCGFASTADEELCFRNLDGEAVVHRELTAADSALVTKAELIEFSKIGSIVIVSFNVQSSTGAGPVMDMRTVFGFFPPAALTPQAGLPASESEQAWLAAPPDLILDLMKPQEIFFGKAPRLSRPPLLMLDRIIGWDPNGGAAGLGRIKAEKDVKPGEWFFKAHFFQDPVQPGSLGVESLLQLLQTHMLLARFAEGMKNPRFEPILFGSRLMWKYRGQVLPTDRKISLLVEIVEISRSPARISAEATGSLWVDGKKIYEVQRLGMAIGSDPIQTPEPLYSPADEILDSLTAPWILDHCPTLVLPTVPLAYIVDLMARVAISACSGKNVTGVKDVAITRWLSVENPLRLTPRIVGITPEGTDIELGVGGGGDGNQPIAAARGTILFSHQGAAPEPVEIDALAPPISGKQLYDEGLLFHGPALQHLIELRRGHNGAVALLEAGSLGVPQGAINPGLLDGMIQIPHDRMAGDWSGATRGHGAFPSSIDRLDFFGPPPLAGLHECRVVSLRQSEPVSSRLAFRIQLLVEGRVRIEAIVRYVSIPIGPADKFPLKDQLKFLRRREAVPGFGLGRYANGKTHVSPADVGPADWLPGTVAAVYDCPGLSGLELLRAVAIKQHVARRLDLHPSHVAVKNGAARISRLPFNRVALNATQTTDGVCVCDVAPPRLDLDPVRDFWTSRHSGHDSVMLALGLAQAARFVRKFEIADKDAVTALRGRATLFLANHQTYQEGACFSILASALFGVPVRILVKSEHRKGWVGALDRFAREEPGGRRSDTFFYFDQSAPESIYGIVEEFARLQEQEPHSLLVFVEGERMRCAGERVKRVSTILPEIALRLRIPIAPVRISGGLPLEGGAQKYDFPFEGGAQDHVIGTAIEPEEIARLLLKERSSLIAESINALPPGEFERPLPGHPDFVEAVRRRVGERGSNPSHVVKATLIEMLLSISTPSKEIQRVVDALRYNEHSLMTPWSRRFVDWLREVDSE